MEEEPPPLAQMNRRLCAGRVVESPSPKRRRRRVVRWSREAHFAPASTPFGYKNKEIGTSIRDGSRARFSHARYIDRYLVRVCVFFVLISSRASRRLLLFWEKCENFLFVYDVFRDDATI